MSVFSQRPVRFSSATIFFHARFRRMRGSAAGSYQSSSSIWRAVSREGLVWAGATSCAGRSTLGAGPVAAFDAAALNSKDTGYIPAALADQMITHIDLLGPRKSGEADFNAPTTPGDYPFLCTFPAHYQAGMRGTLTVK